MSVSPCIKLAVRQGEESAFWIVFFLHRILFIQTFFRMFQSRVVAGLVASLAALASLVNGDLIRGDATFTGNNLGGGTCSFFNYTMAPGLSGVGIGPSNWASGGKCGACLQVNGPRGRVKVMVRDYSYSSNEILIPNTEAVSRLPTAVPAAKPTVSTSSRTPSAKSLTLPTASSPSRLTLSAAGSTPRFGCGTKWGRQGGCKYSLHSFTTYLLSSSRS